MQQYLKETRWGRDPDAEPTLTETWFNKLYNTICLIDDLAPKEGTFNLLIINNVHGTAEAYNTSTSSSKKTFPKAKKLTQASKIQCDKSFTHNQKNRCMNG